MAGARIPAWVAPDLDALGEAWRVSQNIVCRDYSDTRDAGVDAALAWLILGEFAPMTGRTDGHGRETARSESWVALCAAAGQPGPTERDWVRLGAEPRRSAGVSASRATVARSVDFLRS